MSRREIILDTETTGLSPKSGHRMVEIGCIEMIGGSRTGANFHEYINPLRDMPAEAERVHGISGDFLLDKPVFEDIAGELHKFLKEAHLVIHNAAFDMRFLNFEFERCDYAPISMEHVTDTLAIARNKFPGSPANLDALCRRFAIDLSTRTKHGALLDAELLAEVYIELTGGKQVGIDFTAQDESEDDAANAGNSSAILPPRQFAVSPEERAAHDALVNQLSQPIWETLELETA